MKEYLKRRKRNSAISTVTGIAVTVAIHVVAAVFVSFHGMKYIWPPPAEQTFLIDFIQEHISRDFSDCLSRY